MQHWMFVTAASLQIATEICPLPLTQDRQAAGGSCPGRDKARPAATESSLQSSQEVWFMLQSQNH